MRFDNSLVDTMRFLALGSIDLKSRHSLRTSSINWRFRPGLHSFRRITLGWH